MLLNYLNVINVVIKMYEKIEQYKKTKVIIE